MLGDAHCFSRSQVRAGDPEAPRDDRNRVLLIPKGYEDELPTKVRF